MVKLHVMIPTTVELISQVKIMPERGLGKVRCLQHFSQLAAKIEGILKERMMYEK